MVVDMIITYIEAKLVGQKSDYTRKNHKNATNSNSIFSTDSKGIDLQSSSIESLYQYFVYQPRA